VQQQIGEGMSMTPLYGFAARMEKRLCGGLKHNRIEKNSLEVWSWKKEVLRQLGILS
jgi:hypothetical protein